MSALLIDEGADRVVVRLNRPEARNAIDQHMVDEFHARREAHPLIDNIAQAVLFETEGKHDRMTAFLNRKKKG